VRGFAVTHDVDAAGTDGAVTARRDGPVLRVTLNRPGRRNALSHEMIDALVGALTNAATDESLRAIHLTGEGSDFCAGADWVSPNEPGGRHPRAGDLVRRIPHTAHRVVELIHTIHLPVVCTVRGNAVGLGCNLALVADFTLACPDALFWEPFVIRGFSPDSGSTWLLPRLVGLARAKQMLLLGDKVTSTEAAEWGLIHRCVNDSELDDATEDLIARLAAGPTVAIGLTKHAISYAQHATLSQAMTQELFNLELAARTRDFKEGLAAFRQRRAPDFEGR
jgi:2-(1,2-epoxy-1,2-dihydrophenyl)acetyl-CoA isomerase